MERAGQSKDSLEGLNSRSIAELKGLKNPSRQVGDVLEAVLLLTDPPQGTYTWEEARKALSDSRRFLKSLERVDPQAVPEDTRKRLADIFDRDHTGMHPTAQALAHWVVSVCTSTGEPQAKPKPAAPVLLPGAKRSSILESACVVFGPCNELPILRVTPNTITVLKRSSRLWTAWQPDPTLSVFTYDTCMWAAQRRLDAPVVTLPEVYAKSMKELTASVLRGISSCVCLVGHGSHDLLFGKDRVCLQQISTELGIHEMGLEVGVVSVKIDSVDDLLLGQDIDVPEEQPSTQVVENLEELCELLDVTVCPGVTRVIIFQRRLDPKTRFYIVEFDPHDTNGLTAVQNWAVAVRAGGNRLAAHPLQRLAADAFGQHGHVLVLCALHTGSTAPEVVRALTFTQLSAESQRPMVEVEEVDPLTQARQDLAALRKTELSQFRAVVPSPPIQAAAEAALLCLGANPGTGWDGCRSSMCDPNLMRRLRAHNRTVTLSESDHKRLKLMLRRCDALPLGTQEDHKDVVACGMALAQWASAVFALGLVKVRVVRDKEASRRSGQQQQPAGGSCSEAASAGQHHTPAAETPQPSPGEGGGGGVGDKRQPERLADPMAPATTHRGGRGGGVPHAALPPAATAEDGVPPWHTPRSLATPASTCPAEDPLPPPAVGDALDAVDGGEVASDEVLQLRAQLASLEAALHERDQQLALLRHRDLRLRHERHDLHTSPPPPRSAGATTTITPRESQGLVAQSRAPRKDRAPVTQAQSSQLRLSAWKDFVRAARRELSEQELLKVAYETLRKLIMLYKFDMNPVKACRIELHWKEQNYKGDSGGGADGGGGVPFLPVARSAQQQQEGMPRTYPRRGDSPRSQGGKSPSRAAAKSPGAGRDEPRGGGKSPRQRTRSPVAPAVPVKEQPIPQTPETIGVKKRGAVAGVSQRGDPAEEPVPWPKAPAPVQQCTPQRGQVAITDIGERERAAVHRKKDAPVGFADPNRMMEEKDRFHGVAQESPAKARQREMFSVDHAGNVLPCGSKANRADRNQCTDPPQARQLVRHHAAGSAPCNPNDTLTRPSTAHTSRTTNLRPLPAAASNPNDTSAGGYTEMHPVPSSDLLHYPLESAPRRKNLRQNVPSACNPNDLLQGRDDVLYSSPKPGGSRTKAVVSDPNTASGEDAMQRHREAVQRDRVEGDARFHQRDGGSGSNPNVVGAKGGGAPGGKQRVAVVAPAEEAQVVSKKRMLDAPGARQGDARDPILGSDNVLQCGDVTAPRVSAVSRVQTSEKGFVRSDLPSESQPIPSPCSRRRHVTPSTKDLIG